MAEYKVQFEVFEGPMDLLLYLIKKEEVDIYAVNLTKLATQFIEYVELMRQFDLEVAGEFLVIAATLMFIKSRELLPVDQQAIVEGEDEEVEDPRWELIRQLVEYKKFKDAAAQLQVLEARQENVFPRVPGKIEFETQTTTAKPEVGIFDLLSAVNHILKRFTDKEASIRQIYEDKWSVGEKIELVLRLIAERGSLKFSELFASAASRTEVICTFLALLELIRLRQLVCIQPEPFAEIEIRRPTPSAESNPAAPEPVAAVSESAPAPEPAAVAPEPAASVPEPAAPAPEPLTAVSEPAIPEPESNASAPAKPAAATAAEPAASTPAPAEPGAEAAPAPAAENPGAPENPAAPPS